MFLISKEIDTYPSNFERCAIDIAKEIEKTIKELPVVFNKKYIRNIVYHIYLGYKYIIISADPNGIVCRVLGATKRKNIGSKMEMTGSLLKIVWYVASGNLRYYISNGNFFDSFNVSRTSELEFKKCLHLLHGN